MEIAFETVLRVYSGRPGCMCGCRGTYYYPKSNAAEAEKDGGKVADGQVRRVLRLVNAGALEVEDGLGGERIAHVDTGTRTFVVYFRKAG